MNKTNYPLSGNVVFNICSVKIEKPNRLLFKCTNILNKQFMQFDDNTIKKYAKNICQILDNYIAYATEDTVFKAYIRLQDLDKGLVSMDIDHEINIKLNIQEKQRLADLSAMILKIQAKYLS